MAWVRRSGIRRKPSREQALMRGLQKLKVCSEAATTVASLLGDRRGASSERDYGERAASPLRNRRGASSETDYGQCAANPLRNRRGASLERDYGQFAAIPLGNRRGASSERDYRQFAASPRGNQLGAASERDYRQLHAVALAERVCQIKVAATRWRRLSSWIPRSSRLPSRTGATLVRSGRDLRSAPPAAAIARLKRGGGGEEEWPVEPTFAEIVGAGEGRSDSQNPIPRKDLTWK